MLKEQKKFFNLPDSNLYTEKIVSLRTGTKSDREFREIIAATFHHHIPFQAPLQTGGDLKSLLWESDGSINREQLTNLFHKKHFKPMFVKQGAQGEKIPLDVFIDKLKQKPSGGLNNVFFLVGDVGTGKTAFISNLLINHGPKLWGDHQIWNLRIDLELMSRSIARPAIPTPVFFIKALFYQIRDRARTYGLVDIRELDNLHDAKPPELGDLALWEEALAGLINTINKLSKTRPLIIIDNLDFLYHRSDRAIFAKNLRATTSQAQEMIDYMIQLFSEGGKASHCSTNVMMILRNDSLQYYAALRERVKGGEDYLTNRVFSLQKAELCDVLDAHGDLLEEVVKLMPSDQATKKREIFLKAVQQLNENFLRKSKLAEELARLSRQGHRQIIEHFGEHLWLPVGIDPGGQSIVISERFVETRAPSILSFMLGGNRLFSQFDARFPDIYLARSDVFRQREPDLPEELLHDHPHSYFLKRLMVMLVHKRNKQKERVHDQDLYDIFAGATSPGYYQESIVRLCLGSLAQADASHMLKYEFSSGPNDSEPVIDRLTLTDRGQYLAEGFVDSFDYLQLIVDSKDLPIPKKLRDYLTMPTRDYGYLVKSGHDYHKEKEMMITSKFTKVLVFLEMLKWALQFESRLFHKTFQKLAEEEVQLPDFEAIKSKIIGEFGNLFPWIRRIDLYPDYKAIETICKKVFPEIYAVQLK